MRDSVQCGAICAGLSALMIAVLFSNSSITARANLAPDCLYGSANNDEQSPVFKLQDHGECHEDVLGVSGFKEVQKTEEILGLDSELIVFIGCAAAPFKIEPASTIPPIRIRILYPVKPELSAEEHIAPILHELGHAYQLSSAGSINRLLESVQNSIERVELGADFLAGISAARLSLNPGDFEASLYLMGSYAIHDDKYHGRPEDRAGAFRYGYYDRSTAPFNGTQYRDFQDSGFAMITRMGDKR